MIEHLYQSCCVCSFDQDYNATSKASTRYSSAHDIFTLGRTLNTMHRVLGYSLDSRLGIQLHDTDDVQVLVLGNDMARSFVHHIDQ